MTVPKVSVILPTYNRRATLPQAIASVLGQSMPDLELIVVDDGSDDGSTEWLRTVDDPRLHIIHQPQRKGAACARNTGIRAAHAAFIAFHDSDDEWTPKKLELQLAVLHASAADVGFVGGAHQVDGRILRSCNLVRGADYERALLIGEPFVTPTWLVRREVLEGAGLFDESMPCLEDWDLILKISERCRMRAVDDVILLRNRSVDSLYGDTAKRRLGFATLLTRHRVLWLRQPDLYARCCTELGRLYGMNSEILTGRRWLMTALRHDPLNWRAAVLMVASLVNRHMLRLLGSRSIFQFTSARLE